MLFIDFFMKNCDNGQWWRAWILTSLVPCVKCGPGKPGLRFKKRTDMKFRLTKKLWW